MAIKSYMVGPGTLSFTTPSLEISAQVTKAVVTPNVETGDNIHVLSGEVLAGDRTYTGQLEVTALQDLTKSGLIDFSWTNAGKEVSFTYTPNTAEGAKIAGKCVVDPISVGGDAKTRATSDFTWQCPTLPTFTPKAT